MDFAFQEENFLVDDREDLLAILRMRFGSVPAEVIEEIYHIKQLDKLQRLILVAANVPEWSLFLEEMKEMGEPFKLTGERFNPIGDGQGVRFK